LSISISNSFVLAVVNGLRDTDAHSGSDGPEDVEVGVGVFVGVDVGAEVDVGVGVGVKVGVLVGTGENVGV
jgi:hypothetical protein